MDADGKSSSLREAVREEDGERMDGSLLWGDTGRATAGGENMGVQ